MIPLWVKDREGKWCRFPYEVLTQLPNGKLGISFKEGECVAEAFNAIGKLCEETGWDVNQFFDYDIASDAYILKEKAGEKP